MNKRPDTELRRLVNEAEKQVTIGATYRHYKQHDYKVVELAFSEANDELCVVYQALYGERIVYLRPLDSWLEEMTLADGSVVKRFAKV